MNEAILVLNAGSSSVKFALYGANLRPSRHTLLCEGVCDGIGHEISFAARDRNGAALLATKLGAATTHEDALGAILSFLTQQFPDDPPAVAAHRVVHGGAVFSAPVIIDEKVVAELRRLAPLAPLHQPHHLAAIEAFAKLHPALPQVACFDTAFHQTEPRLATTYALPRHLTEEGLRRYGFHGLSYEYIAGELPDTIGPAAARGRIVVAHLGSGASMCALREGRSVATTMGFTALDGLPMSRRCGSLDPGILLYLLSEKGMTTEAISDLLYQQSGLLGVSGISDDMKSLLDSEEPQAAQAVDLFIYRICRELGSLAAALGGLDALVFTAGIGEHAAEIRRAVCERSAWLGFALDEGANRGGGPRITTQTSRTSAWVIPTDEALMIARHSWDLRAGSRSEAAAQSRPGAMMRGSA